MADFLFRGSLADLDSDVFELAQIEAERQARKLILIPSESQAPLAVREAMATAFQNIYAEGYPDEEMRSMTEAEILDYDSRLAHYRRYSDPRYYKGVEYADIIESLARRRCAELFAANGVAPEDIYVNVQPLSGAPANMAVYTALASPGDTVMGMNLLYGGHLTHGSPVNRSGKFFNIVSYTVDPETEKISYEQIEALATEHKPKFIIAGFSSYSWQVDWSRLKSIAKSVGAYLMADISHVAGLVAGGVYPSPVGIADIITFTTHKTLCGPRGACILATEAALARKLDRGLFPGEQGGPHLHAIAAMATAFKLNQSEQFRQLQAQIVKNCAVFTDQLRERGFRIPFGGTDTHLMNLDTTTVKSPDGATLSGDQAARILDLVGIVVNRNTIPGDTSAFDPNGIRMGTPWVTQRGLKEADMVELANIIADVLLACKPFNLEGRKGEMRRTKVDFGVLENAKLRVRKLAQKAGLDFEPTQHGYPHFYYIDDQPQGEWGALEIKGERARAFMNYVATSDVEALEPGQRQLTRIFTSIEEVDGELACIDPYTFRLTVPADKFGLVAAWLRDISDGFIVFGDDPLRKIPGPVSVAPVTAQAPAAATGDPMATHKPFFVAGPCGEGQPLPAFTWQDVEGPLRRTPVYEVHKQLGAKIIPFAGWEMPVWYSSVMEEHMAVRTAAGIFDVAHMGVYQVEGPDAAIFLDSVVGNDVLALGVGESMYTHFLTPAADVIDDLLVYHRGVEKFLVVVNASNDDKDWTWLNAVKDGKVQIDPRAPWARAYGRKAILRNLRDPKEGADMRVDIALQGPRSRDILLALGVDAPTRKRIMRLKRTELCDAVIGGFDLVVSRTGYTGEKMAFELFVHPDQAAELFTSLLKVGESYGLKPIGLGARDSLRTEAGLPLYGHEMGLGSDTLSGRDLGVAEGGFGSYVKTYKPWFIGRDAFVAREAERKTVVARFRFTEKGVRMAHHGDPVLDKRGKVIGFVTSCAVDKEGFLTGQALVDIKSAEEGTPVSIFQSASDKAGKAPADLKLGEKSILPTPATIVSRFMK